MELGKNGRARRRERAPGKKRPQAGCCTMKSYLCLSRAATTPGVLSTEERRKKTPQKSDQFGQMGEGFGDLFGIAGTAHGAIGAAAAIAAGELAKSADELTGVDTGFHGLGAAS